MAKRPDVETVSYAVGSGHSWIQTKRTSNEISYFEGAVISPNGLVDVYSQVGHTLMVFVWKGRQYRRVWKRQFSPRGLSAKAKAFAKEIASLVV